MLFPTATFAIFFAIVLPLSWLLMPRGTWWRPFIIAASYVFYGWWDWRFIALLAISTVGNQLFAVGIFKAESRTLRRWLLGAAVVLNLGLLAYFKYVDFFISQAQGVAESFGMEISRTVLVVVLPVGISFFTFQALSYVIDIYRGDLRPTTLPKFAVLMSFFPHLVAGPIVRPSEFVPQLDSPRDPRRVDTGRAFGLIIAGLFMKVVIANLLATEIVDDVFAAPDQYSSLETLVAVYGYSVQIFADFFGYTAIAIGIALLLGFELPQNFDNPYTAATIQDFWRRWHMTLSRWLRDYLYIPLGGSRHGERRTYLNLFAVMVIGGLWHGAAWTFVVWGAIHGSVLVVERWRQVHFPHHGTEALWSPARRWVARIITFQIVCFAWIFFRATSFDNAFAVITQLFSAWGQPSPLVTTGVLLAIAVGIGVQYVPYRVVGQILATYSRLPTIAQAVIVGLCLMVTNTMGPVGVAPFIYFQF